MTTWAVFWTGLGLGGSVIALWLDRLVSRQPRLEPLVMFLLVAALALAIAC
jgi:hypothetical protein